MQHTATYTTAHIAPHTASVSTTRIWIGRFIGGFAALSLLLDGATKALQLAPVLEASAQLGLSASLTLGLGVLELACLAAYLIPRTAPLGAILLTGYLGGAMAIHLRLGSPAFSVVFPLILGAMLWAGLALRDRRLRVLLAPQT